MSHRTAFVGSVEAMFVAASLIAAFLLQFNFRLPEPKLIWVSLPILLVIRLLLLARFNLMRGWWRYTGVNEIIEIIKAVSFGSVIFFVVLYGAGLYSSYPVSIFVLEGIITTLLLLSGRMISRILAEATFDRNEISKLIIVIGAGRGADLVISEIARPGSGYSALACLDDDATKVGISIRGVKVEGNPEQLPELLKKYAADEVWIAVPSATSAQMNRFVLICEASCVRYKTLPSLRDIILDRDVINQIREVKLDDLLGRDTVRVNLDIVREQVEGRSVIVTGAAGSIGAELCAQLLEYDPAVLVCVDQNENGTFFLQQGHKSHRNSSKIVYCVADVCNRARMAAIFKEYEVQLIFHAAAYKHVPMMEANVQEAVQNNVFSLLELLSIAEEADCESFVMISSDKAVNPTNVMGTTKRICELILSSRPTRNMRCVSVRFGNVLGSSGSVVPILQEQIRQNAEITITHPEIRRYFMTIQEAVSLVLQAFTVGEHGDLLVLDMGDSVRIMDLARRLIRLNGKSESDVQIRIIGLRDGEKLTEEMFYETEKKLPTVCEKIKKTRGKIQDWDELEPMLKDLRLALQTNFADSVEAGMVIRSKMKKIVPEFDYAKDLKCSDELTSDAYTSPFSNGRPSAMAAGGRT
ncbi:MAG: polysaccharide biosynthesis protein CapD [Acidobacteriaceae bacterium]|nr:polysaccharide biosynthesis protein CapD [Acidobacteriaceae bacterium]